MEENTCSCSKSVKVVLDFLHVYHYIDTVKCYKSSFLLNECNILCCCKEDFEGSEMINYLDNESSIRRKNTYSAICFCLEALRKILNLVQRLIKID